MQACVLDNLSEYDYISSIVLVWRAGPVTDANGDVRLRAPLEGAISMDSFNRRLREIIEDRCSLYEDLDEVVGPHDEMAVWHGDGDGHDAPDEDGEGEPDSSFFNG